MTEFIEFTEIHIKSPMQIFLQKGKSSFPSLSTNLIRNALKNLCGRVNNAAKKGSHVLAFNPHTRATAELQETVTFL